MGVDYRVDFIGGIEPLSDKASSGTQQVYLLIHSLFLQANQMEKNSQKVKIKICWHP